MLSHSTQQNKQPPTRRISNNKFLSIKSILRNKKIPVKKSVPANSPYMSNCVISPPQYIEKKPTQSFTDRQKTLHNEEDDGNSKNIINITFEKYCYQSGKQRQPKIRRRILNNFGHEEQKRNNSTTKDLIPDNLFEDTLTIEAVKKIDPETQNLKKKRINVSSNQNYMVLTKKNRKNQIHQRNQAVPNKTMYASRASNKTVVDFKNLGRELAHSIFSNKQCFTRKTITSCSNMHVQPKSHTCTQNFWEEPDPKRTSKSNFGEERRNELIEKPKHRRITAIKQRSNTKLTNETFNQSLITIGNNSKPFKDLIPIRKPTLRKDHFVFSMTEKPSNDVAHKIQLYRDFLWKINYSNGLYVHTLENLDFTYKAYFGYGNNSCMLKGILKRRYWWNVIETDKNSINDCNFVWTQLKVNSFFKNQVCKEEPSVIAYDDEDLELRQNYLTILQNDKQQTEESKIDNLLGYNSKIFNGRDFKNWHSHFQKNQKVEEKISQQTYIKRSTLYKKKEITKIDDSSKLRIHNHLENNFYIGNKKALFYNIKKLCQLRGVNPFSIIPITYHISKGIEDAAYENFLNCYNHFEKIKATDRNFRNMWICKPGENSNRGNGITVCMGIDDIRHRLRGREKNSDGRPRTFILQKYIQRPFLFKNRKFDIRHYLLITCINSNIKAYWYDEGYVRTSSSVFNLKNNDTFVHLTNDAVQKKCQTYGKHEKGNKISYNDFQKYLNSSHKKKKLDFLGKTLKAMKEIAFNTIEATYSSLDPNRREHNFQLIGFDFMIDDTFTPWLIEANTNPCLELSCPLLEKMIPNLIQQVYRICIDPFFPPPQNWSNSKRQWFGQNILTDNKFELIFDESIHGQKIKKLYEQNKTNQEYDMLLNKIEEDDQVFENDGDDNWEQKNAN